MATRDTADAISRLIETSRGAGLSDEERGQIELWQKGKALQQLTSCFGWEVVLEMIQSYPQDAVRQLLNVKPGDNDRVLAAHAVAYALNDFYNKFLEDVKNAIENGKAPDFVKQSVHKVRSEMPLESLA